MSSGIPYQFDSASIPDSDTSGICTPTTTSEDMFADFLKDHNLRSWVPSHGATVIIRSVSCGNVLALLDGHVVLAPPRDCESTTWTCVETDGWFGFRNCITNKFICHGWDGRLKCSAEQHDGWRHFTITPVPKRGYVMQMLDWFVLRPIVRNAERGLPKVGRTGSKLSEEIVWEFIKVE
jgi:hypothetical protein